MGTVRVVEWEWFSLEEEGPEPDLLAELLRRPDWHRDALCREHPEVDWFPERGGSLEPAKAICERCLVQVECLTSAVELDERHGIWAGAGPKTRQALRRSQTAA